MPGSVNWLHLSDWHQPGGELEHDRKVVTQRMLEDIRERGTRIGPVLEKIDFVVFSGDVAYNGRSAEYEAAVKYLFEPVLEATGVGWDRLFVVPGNHDLDWSAFELLPAPILHPFSSNTEVDDWLSNPRKLARLLEPYEAYYQFAERYMGRPRAEYAYSVTFEAGGRKIGLAGLNSALISGRNREARTGDYGCLVVGEPQVEKVLGAIAGADVRLAVLHHPFAWLAEFDKERVERQLRQSCHFILCGHQHTAMVSVSNGTEGDCVVTPAGASYDRRVPSGPGYPNGCNFTSLNLDTGQGAVYLRRWAERPKAWIADTEACEQGRIIFALPKQLARAAETGGRGRARAVAVARPERRVIEFKGQEYVYIPPGTFPMGSSEAHVRELSAACPGHDFGNECDQHPVDLDGYYIARYPVTNAQYLAFVQDQGHPVPFRDDEWSREVNWDRKSRTFPAGKGEHPVVLVSWYDAQAYCRWLGGRLPTEAEWEKAARGTDGREWPWGNTWQADRCNAGSVHVRGTTPVAHFGVRGESPYGVADMAGNVWEWCSSLPDPYPYDAHDGREAPLPPGKRVQRGGAWGLPRYVARCAARAAASPDDFGFTVGFRVVLDAPAPG